MSRSIVAIYGVFAYLIGMGGLTCFIVFLSGWEFLPLHINSGDPGNIGIALATNTFLMLLFGVHHSIAARPWFKSLLTRVIPAAAERSTYVLASGVFMLAFVLFWMPLPGELWRAETPVLVYLLTGGYLVGWTIAVIATFLINHFELFGLQQIYVNLLRKSEPKSTFVETGMYRIVRHPLQFGILLGIWMTPNMTFTHFYLAVTMTIYILIGLYYEEKDLVRFLGEDYLAYQRRVNKLIPSWPKKKPDLPAELTPG